MPEIACVNGTFLPLAEAYVHVEDRGFQFADGVYEVLTAFDGKPFRLAGHLERLARSAAAIRLRYDPRELESQILRGIRESEFREVLAYVQITRGTAPRAHVISEDVPSTVVMTFKKWVPLDPELRKIGAGLITLEDIRWKLCQIKSIALLPNVMARRRARESKAFEAVFVSGGNVREGAVSNLFVVNGEVLATPEVDDRILAGIIREFVLEAALARGISVEIRPVKTEELHLADEVFICSTTAGVLGMVRADGRTIGSGQVGPVTRLLHQDLVNAREHRPFGPSGLGPPNRSAL